MGRNSFCDGHDLGCLIDPRRAGITCGRRGVGDTVKIPASQFVVQIEREGGRDGRLGHVSYDGGRVPLGHVRYFFVLVRGVKIIVKISVGGILITLIQLIKRHPPRTRRGVDITHPFLRSAIKSDRGRPGRGVTVIAHGGT